MGFERGETGRGRIPHLSLSPGSGFVLPFPADTERRLEIRIERLDDHRVVRIVFRIRFDAVGYAQ